MRKGWEIKRLGDVIKLEYGKPLPDSKRKPGGKYPVYGANGEKDRTDEYYHDKKSVIVGRKGSAGEINLTENKFWPLDVTYFVTFDKTEYDLYFLYHLLTLLELPKLAKGVKPGINRNEVYDINVPIPLLPEQRRIVAILDEAFAAIDKAMANAEKNLQNANELFESYLQSVFENKGESWEEKALGEIADVEYGYTDKSTEQGDYRYIRITDIDKNGELILDEKKYIKYSKEAEGFLIEENDLLMARTGATFAKVLFYKDYEPSVFASYLIRIKFKEKINNKLYWYFTKTKYYWEQANSLSSGAAQPHFNGAAVKQMIFSYPKSEKEQKLLIEKFDALSAETKKLETIYQQKLNDLEELKKSILQKAFKGELITAKAVVV
jgi:type I restriction enzyme, S subunit